MGQRHEKTKRRLTAMWLKQGGRCIYCEVVVPLAFVSSRPYGMKIGLWRKVRGTVEHVHRICEGGRDVKTNRVMACSFCNHSGEDTEPMAHREEMLYQMRIGTHPCFEAKLFEKTIYDMVKSALPKRGNIGGPSGVLHSQNDRTASPDQPVP